MKKQHLTATYWHQKRLVLPLVAGVVEKFPKH
jgi:hypothetical protein